MDHAAYEPRTDLPQELAELRLLALDLRWSWSHVADALWRRIDETLWRHTRNPWLILQTVSARRLDELAGDESFRALLQELREEQKEALGGETWFSRKHGDSGLQSVAYFCMEYGLSEALPLYSGGLGILAGDHLKTCSELGVPLHAVGLLYQQGYFRQGLSAEGEQLAFYPFNDPMQLPILPVRNADGEWLTLCIDLPGRPLHLRTWQAQVGRVRLYLLDSNHPLNDPADRGITSELYGGGPELRLQQEMVLGMGGWRLLESLELAPQVCHLNEGHAAFAILERARCFMQRQAVDFHTALNATRAGNLFTTHTPVEAGFDRFAPELFRNYLTPWCEQADLDVEELLQLGRANPSNSREPFNMAWLAIHGSGAINGVSRLHGKVSRRLFGPLFPHWPLAEVPVGHVTNGVHVPSWDSIESDRLWTAACSKERWREELHELKESVSGIEDRALWEMRSRNRQRLIEWIRQRGTHQQPFEQDRLALLDPNVLTIGFARRFATYKRPNLLLHDPDRLAALLTHPERPVQLVIAGKAHPLDHEGQRMIREWFRFIRDRGLERHAAFLVDYDLLTASHLVEGVDLWVNTPRRPWEACGTSGMKVLVNGGLNLSELDGWWAEAWEPGLGWPLGDGREHDADPAWDAQEANTLYELLENEIVPLFYERNALGIPEGWVSAMRRSMAELTPRFSSNRMVREYTEDYYLPLAGKVARRSADGAALAGAIRDWQQQIQAHWPAIHFGNVEIRQDELRIGVQAQVYLDELPADTLSVELYADPRDEGAAPERHPLQRVERLAGSVNGYLYTALIPSQRPASDYTLRVVPNHPDALVPLEANAIHWQR
ncbi:MAG TPA: alpha-glucan family phosphorylase [Thiotrichales bacterium]|nr:alpha-glucan family phosphorylase [Thiotrichales bacterium]